MSSLIPDALIPDALASGVSGSGVLASGAGEVAAVVEGSYGSGDSATATENTMQTAMKVPCGRSACP